MPRSIRYITLLTMLVGTTDLPQINSMSTGDSEGPAWNKFWMSMDQGDTESMMSGEGNSHAPHTPDHRSAMMSPDLQRPDVERLDSLMPGDSASHHGATDIEEASAFIGAPEEAPFTFKFKSPSGRVHRLQVTASAGLEDFVAVVAQKLGAEADGIGGIPSAEDGRLSRGGFALSYLDNEGDTVSLTTDHDLLEAITLARQGHKDKVDLFVHDPDGAALPATLDPQPALTSAPPPTPPESMIRRRKQAEDDEETTSPVEGRRRERKSAGAMAEAAKGQEQLVPGVPNELLLPGALVALGAVIVITFALGRSSSR